MKSVSRHALFGILAFAAGSIAWIILYLASKALGVPQLHLLTGNFLGASVGYAGICLLQDKRWKPSIKVGCISGAAFAVGYFIGLIGGEIPASIFGPSVTGSTAMAGMAAGAAGSAIYCVLLNERSKAITIVLAGAIGFAFGSLAVYGPGFGTLVVSSKQVLGFPVGIVLIFVSGGVVLGAAQGYCQKASVSQIHRCNKYLTMLFAVLGVSVIFWAPLRLTFHNSRLYSELTPADKNYARLQEKRRKGLTGKRAPEIVTTALDGSAWALSDHKGKVVLLDFWATWCGPCRGALPEIKVLCEKFRNRPDFLLVGISLDEERVDPAKFCKNEGIDWIQLFEPGKAWRNSVAESFEVRAIPEMCLINKDGVIVGINLTVPDADRMLEELLAKKQSRNGH